jgi:hypothetical protein
LISLHRIKVQGDDHQRLLHVCRRTTNDASFAFRARQQQRRPEAAGRQDDPLSARRGEAADLAVFAAAVALASAMLLFVGLCYRLVNAHWILQSVRTPPPRLDDVIDR